MSRDEIVCKAQQDMLEKCIVISIMDPGITVELNNDNIVDILRLGFNDVEKIVPMTKAMCTSDGDKIKEFIDKYKDEVSNIIVHCAMGQSRSAAVGAALQLCLNGDDRCIWGNDEYNPNIRCYDITTRAFGMRLSRQVIQEKKKVRAGASEVAQSKSMNDYGVTLNDMFGRLK